MTRLALTIGTALLAFQGQSLITQPKQPNPRVAAWEALRPSIQETLSREGLRCSDLTWQVSVIDATEFADGLSVALVDYCNGGAYTDSIVAMQLQNGKPVLSHFRSTDGPIANIDFSQGSSVMHSVDVRLMPRKNAIYDIHYDTDGTRLLSCTVRAFVWSFNSTTFEWNGTVTRQATRDCCRDVRQHILK